MDLAWPLDAVQHTWDRHRITPAQAEEALSDPFVLVVIVVRHQGRQYGANGWPANDRDATAYWDHRREKENG